MSGRSRNCSGCDRKIIGLQDSEICNKCDLELDKEYQGARHLPAGRKHPRTIEQERLRQLDRRLAGLPDDSHRLISIDLPKGNPDTPSNRYEVDAELLSRSSRMSYRGKMRTYVDDYGFTREEAKQKLSKEHELYGSELEEIAASEEEIYQGKLRRRRCHERRAAARSVSDSREAESDSESIVNLDQLPERLKVTDLSKLSPLAQSTRKANYRHNKYRYRERLKAYEKDYDTREEAKSRLLEEDVYISDIEVHDASEDEEYRANRRQQRNYERAKAVAEAVAEAERSEADESGVTTSLDGDGDGDGDDEDGNSVMTEKQERSRANSVAGSTETAILDPSASYATKEKTYLSRLRSYIEMGHSREEAKKRLFQQRAEYGSDFRAIATGEDMSYEADGLVARSGFHKGNGPGGSSGLRGGGGEDDYVDEDENSVVLDEQRQSSTSNLETANARRSDKYESRRIAYSMNLEGAQRGRHHSREEARQMLRKDPVYGSDLEEIEASEEEEYRRNKQRATVGKRPVRRRRHQGTPPRQISPKARASIDPEIGTDTNTDAGTVAGSIHSHGVGGASAGRGTERWSPYLRPATRNARSRSSSFLHPDDGRNDAPFLARVHDKVMTSLPGSDVTRDTDVSRGTDDSTKG